MPGLSQAPIERVLLTGLPVALLLGGCARESVAAYGSGGFTSLDRPALQQQLGAWAEQGLPFVKMKVGRDPAHDLERVAAAREAIGEHCTGAVDVLQADASRCGGLTGFMRAAALRDAFGLPLSSHCAPALHVAACCCASRVVHLEWFHDHQRIERLLFDGAPQPRHGRLAPDLSRPGLRLAFKARDAQEYAA